MLKYFFSLSLLLCPLINSFEAEGQRMVDYGLLAGVCYYNGEVNPVRILYKPRPAYGGFFRLNLNKRYAIRISGSYNHLAGDDNDFPERLSPARLPVAFTTRIFDFNTQLEFNFMPYITGEERWLRSLYISGGIGYAMIPGSSSTPVIPFGLGYKINITDRLSTGAEWGLRKTFSDNINNVPSVLGNTIFNNNDWYSFVGLFISYKFVKFAADCPAYKKYTP